MRPNRVSSQRFADLEHAHSPVAAPAMISRSTVVAKLPADKRETQPQRVAGIFVLEIANADAQRAPLRLHAFGVRSRPAPREIAPATASSSASTSPLRQRLALRPASGAVGCTSSAAQRCSSSASDCVDGEHAAAAVEIRDVARRQSVPGAPRHALREDGIEDEAARGRQHEARHRRGRAARVRARALSAFCASRLRACAAPAPGCPPRARSAARRNS